MIPFANFIFSQEQTRRRKILSDVMPAGSDFAYFLVLSDAYLDVDGSERHIYSLDDFREVLNCCNILRSLQSVRTNGQLSEGRHALPDAVAGCLAKTASGLPDVRRWIFGSSKPIITTLDIADIKDAWARSAFEEVEVGEPSGKWYFRARDDEALVFLAVRAGPLLDQIQQCRRFCQEVSGEFEYAR